MEPKVHEIDPRGDTLLILRCPNAPFAAPPPPPAEQLGQPEQPEQQEQPKSDAADEPQESDGGQSEVRMRLSSGHLRLASPVFRQTMAPEWKEMTDGDYSYVVDAQGWDEEALLLVMKIIHGKTADVPTTVDLEMLAKIATVIDHYQCHEAVSFFHSLWVRPMMLLRFSGRDLLLLLSVSCVFAHPNLFERTTKDLIRESEEPIASLGLPIPEGAIDRLNNNRERFISNIIVGLKALIEDELAENKRGCSFDCSSVIIGALSKGMDALRISDKYLAPPYAGHSLKSLHQGILGWREPCWRRICEYHRFNNCSLSAHTQPLVNEQLNRVVELHLWGYVGTT